MQRLTIRDVNITFKLVLLSCCTAYFMLTGCDGGPNVPGDIAQEVYVLVPPGKEREFTIDLGDISKRHGMRPNLGSAIDDKGLSLYVLEAVGQTVQLRSENVLLSGHEDDEICGSYSEPHSDPGQFFIAIHPKSRKTSPEFARRILSKIIVDLRKSGYTVNQEPIICSPQSKSPPSRDPV